MALVSSYKSLSETQQSNKSSPTQEVKESKMTASGKVQSELEGGNDPDLQRALDLVDLHYGVKMKHVQGQELGLQKARADVARALQGR